jgi:hypothetical protein
MKGNKFGRSTQRLHRLEVYIPRSIGVTGTRNKLRMDQWLDACATELPEHGLGAPVDVRRVLKCKEKKIALKALEKRVCTVTS